MVGLSDPSVPLDRFNIVASDLVLSLREFTKRMSASQQCVPEPVSPLPAHPGHWQSNRSLDSFERFHAGRFPKFVQEAILLRDIDLLRAKFGCELRRVLGLKMVFRSAMSGA
jgi:hypothetical protein